MVSLKKIFQLLTSQKNTEAQLFINRRHTGVSKCQLLFQDRSIQGQSCFTPNLTLIHSLITYHLETNHSHHIISTYIFL